MKLETFLDYAFYGIIGYILISALPMIIGIINVILHKLFGVGIW